MFLIKKIGLKSDHVYSNYSRVHLLRDIVENNELGICHNFMYDEKESAIGQKYLLILIFQ